MGIRNKIGRIDIRNTGPINWAAYWAGHPEAKVYIDATGITDETIWKAVGTLFTDLIAINATQTGFIDFVTPANSILKALYPLAGDTAFAQKWNAVNPVDTDAAFRLNFANDNVGAHSSNGYKPDGVNQYANTYLTPNTHLTLNSTHLALYPTENIADGDWIGGTRSGIDIGSRSGSDEMFICTRDANDKFGAYQYGSTGGLTGYNCDSRAFFITSRVSDLFTWFQDGIRRFTAGAQVRTMPTNILTLGAWNYPTYTTFSNKNYGFCSIGYGITNAACVLYDAAVYKYMRALDRIAARPPTTERAGVAITFDDTTAFAYLKNWTYYKSMYGLEVTMAPEATSFTEENITDGDLLKAIGWEFGSHADIAAYRATHTPAETYTALIKPNADAITAAFGVDVKTFTYHINPEYDPDLMTYLATQGYLNIRMTTGGSPYYDGSDQIFYTAALANTLSYAEHVALIDDALANDKILIYMGHYITATVDIYTISADLLAHICAYIRSKNMKFYLRSELIPALF